MVFFYGIALFLLALVVLEILGAEGPVDVFVAIVVVASVLGYGMAALDKSAAVRNKHRVSERSMYLVSLAGGWPGAVLAQHTHHHKTRKYKFQLTQLFVICLHLLGSALLFAWY